MLMRLISAILLAAAFLIGLRFRVNPFRGFYFYSGGENKNETPKSSIPDPNRDTFRRHP
jgi:hypothetical protein